MMNDKDRTDIEKARAKREREMAQTSVDQTAESLDVAMARFDACIAEKRPIDPTALAKVLAGVRRLINVFLDRADYSEDVSARETYLSTAERYRAIERRFLSMPVDDERVDSAGSELYEKVAAACDHDSRLYEFFRGAFGSELPMGQLAAMVSFYSLEDDERTRIEDGTAAAERQAELNKPRSPFWEAFTDIDHAMTRYERGVDEQGDEAPSKYDLVLFLAATRWMQEKGPRAAPPGSDGDMEAFLEAARLMYRASRRKDPSGDPRILLRPDDEDGDDVG